ncbi:MAG TPA: ABC transporter substrate-binding protein [Egibacteraceae bacterium]|nr:ABC transporter substrate-binding protein [Egibacteraceae bacterium]
MATTRWRMLAILMLVLSLVATACGGGDDDADTDGDGGDGGGSAVGVTDDPCPNAVNADNGCIYLGIISDLTEGPFRALAVPLTDAQKAFWARVNNDGGIGGYDIDVETHIKDNKYIPETHKQVFEEIRGDVLGLAQTLGSPQTAAIIQDLRDDSIVAAPASWTSAWEFEDVIIESGTNYCMEMANAVDWYAEEQAAPTKVMAIHYPGDYGDDAAAGARLAAERIGAEFVDHPTQPGQENQSGAVAAIVQEKPDLVVVTTGPTELATIVGGAASQGFTGKVIGSSPTWNPALLQTAAAPALKAMYFQAGPWGPWGTESAGHAALREAFPDTTPNDGYVAGWVWQYPLKAALEKAVEDGNLTREGLLEAVKTLETVDYEGMLPEEAGNYAGEPADAVFRQSVVSQVDDTQPTGVNVVADFFTGPTAEGMAFDKPCFEA